MKYCKELTQIKNLVSEEVWEIFVRNNVIIAGGTLTSVFCNREVNDIDVYVRSETDFINFVTDVYDYDYQYKLLGANVTSRSILFHDSETKQDVQLIVYKYFETPQHIFNDYDFTINMAALEVKTEQFHFHEDFFKHNSQRYLQFHTGTAYPLISALRVQKYIEKGYTISKSQMLRLLLTISQIDIQTWNQLKDEIGGMYGLNMDEVFPEKEEFSLEKAIAVLDEIISDKKFHTGFASISQDVIWAKFFPNKIINGKYALNKFFKNVEVIGDDICSAYTKEFKYVVGEIVDGGKYGIYCYRGSDVLSGQYNHYNKGNIILELEPIKEDLQENFNSVLQLMGPIKVVAKYTRDEFIEKYFVQIQDKNEPEPPKFEPPKLEAPKPDFDPFFPFA
jgi:hypothetical protein